MMKLLKQPSAWIPITIPLIFFIYLVTYLAIFGIVRSEDEGIGAHLFQLWLVLEPAMIGYFAVRWMPQAPKPALIIIAIQILSTLVACAPVFYFNL